MADYNENILKMNERMGIVVDQAATIKSEKRQHIYNTCVDSGNSLTEYGAQQLEEMKLEFCTAVTSELLESIRYKYKNLSQIIWIYRRPTTLELLETSPLSEEEVVQRNTPLLDQTEYEILGSFLIDYSHLFNFLPGGMDN